MSHCDHYAVRVCAQQEVREAVVNIAGELLGPDGESCVAGRVMRHAAHAADRRWVDPAVQHNKLRYQVQLASYSLSVLLQ